MLHRLLDDEGALKAPVVRNRPNRRARQDRAAAPHPGLHGTPRVDDAIVLSGAVVAIIGDAGTRLRTGDDLVARGTVHARAIGLAAMARLAVGLVDRPATRRRA